MATNTDTTAPDTTGPGAETPKPPRRTLAAGIFTGAAIGAAVGITAAFTLVLALGAVDMAGPLGRQAFIYLVFEAGFAGAILGGAFTGLMRLGNRR
ncbi:hypothetical protein ACWCOP_00685 [Maricaulaceae bacterium MS644]